MKVFYIILILRFALCQAQIRREFHEGGFHLYLKDDETPFMSIKSENMSGSPQPCIPSAPNEKCYAWGPDNQAIMRIRSLDEEESCTDIVMNFINNVLYFYNDIERYGGPEFWEQLWPMNKLLFSEEAYVTQSLVNQAITEPYWITSNGVATYIYNAPGFLSQDENRMMYETNTKPPYFWPEKPFEFRYTTCIGSDVRRAHELILQNNIIAKPKGIPDERMITHPIWSTWARYKKDINAELVQTFANEIRDHGFNDSQLEIDDNWETCYGSLTFNTDKFPDMKQLTDQLKKQGFRVTLWIHPFINNDCSTHEEAQVNGYFVATKDGSTETSWWNGQGGIVDMTNAEAATWWAARVKALQNEGIDSFKFDAGESSWMPVNGYLPNVADTLQPLEYTRAYVRKCAEFGNMIEVRSGAQTQDLDVFVRMIDKDSRWGYNNGLRSLITTLLVMNIQGYTLVLPDMIGGNGYGETPTKELFIRWLQANTFMPSLQFSYVPWDYDDETVEISKKYTALHVQYAEKIIELAKKSTVDGSPINPPVWWIAPSDKETFNIDDEYLLGEDILVAPIVEENATSRDIYLPAGVWKDELRGDEITGPQWLRGYQVALDELAYFTKIN